MAGTFADINLLANNADFRTKVQVALLKRATRKLVDPGAAESEINIARRLISGTLPIVESVSLAIASAYPEISAAAPAVPTDAVTQTAVDLLFAHLAR